MYVALTRARHQAVVWWAGTKDCRFSPLGRLVFFRGEDGAIADAGAFSPTDEAAMERFGAIAAGAEPGCISVERSALGMPVSWSPRLDPLAALDAASFSRDLDRRWRRTSYSDLTAGAHEAVVGSEPEADVVSDEPRGAGAGRGRGWGRRCRCRCRPRFALAARRDAGRRARRDVHPRRPRGDGLRCGRPSGRAFGARGARAGAPLGRDRSPPTPWSRGWPPRSRRRSVRSPATCGCATCRAPTGSTSSTFELPLAGGDLAVGRGHDGRDRVTCCAAMWRRATRWPATPTASATRSSATPSAAISPAASTSCSACRAPCRASRSSTTSRTGSRRRRRS